jgi:hypothetical protein
MSTLSYSGLQARPDGTAAVEIRLITASGRRAGKSPAGAFNACESVMAVD